MKTHFLSLVSTAVLLSCVCSFATAQEIRLPGQRDNDDDVTRPRPQTTGRADRASDEQVVKYFAAKLMLMNAGTICISQVAEKNSSSEEVKQFAQELARSHKQLNQQVMKLAPDAARIASVKQLGRQELGFRGDDEPGERPDNDRNDRDQTDPGKAADDRGAIRQPTGSRGPLDQILTIERQATENYVDASTKMLEQYKGQDFDMGFLGCQIGAHTWALAELKAMDSVGDEQFQALVRQTTQHTEQHLQKAKQLSEKFENDRTTRDRGTTTDLNRNPRR